MADPTAEIPITPDESDSELHSPASTSADSSEANTPLETSDQPESPKRFLRSVSDTTTLAPNSSPLRVLASARNPPRPPMPTPAASSILGGGMAARLRDFHEKRMGVRPGAPGAAAPGSNPLASHGNQPHSPSPPGALPGSLRLPPGISMPPNMRPGPGIPHNSAPAIPGRQKPSLSERRLGGMKLPGMDGRPGRPAAPKLSDMAGGGGLPSLPGAASQGSRMDDFKKYIDAEKGWITFDGAATITRTGVNFANGNTFSISLDEVQVLGELGKGNYGTVYKVRHAPPRQPRFGPGLAGLRHAGLNHTYSDPSPVPPPGNPPADNAALSPRADGTTGAIMAMKEIRLELDDAKFTTILKELVILHECVSPYIIDFYGAFFQEGAVYICIEYMDGGSIDKLYAGGIPEGVLRKITYATVMGLKSLKDEHNIIHRDVKPTNILVNTRGKVKICDFGVSGNLVASIAKTNIGCQSYMAPERIAGGAGTGGVAQPGGSDGTYSVQSDIWSLGLTIIECAMGRYPYPPEVSSTIFSQLSAIVDGDPPDLPSEGYSQTARDFVRGCLNKKPAARPTYAMLLNHGWLAPLAKPQTIAEEDEDEVAAAEQATDGLAKLSLGSGVQPGEDEEVAAWARSALQGKRQERKSEVAVNGAATPRPALHAAPLDTTSPAASPAVNMAAEGWSR